MPLTLSNSSHTPSAEETAANQEESLHHERGRWRTISIRLTDEEYLAVSTVHSKAGFRSMSDFGRTAILDRARMLSGQRSLLSASLLTLGSRLSDLDNHLKELRSEIGLLLGGEHQNGGTHPERHQEEPHPAVMQE